MKKTFNNPKGFTLLELMVAMAIFGIVMAGMVNFYSLQLRSHITQQAVVDMHQNARAAMMIMKHEIKMAGLDGLGTANTGITIADQNQIQFTLDNNDDGDSTDGNERIRYALSGTDLGRDTGGGLQPVAENFEVLDFVYLDDRISDNTDDDGDGTIDEPDEALMATPVTGSDLDDIRMVQITIVARNGQNVPVFSFQVQDTNNYVNQQGTVVLAAQNDMFRRTLLTSNVYLRNLVP